ncbi:diaminopropionate ammonia-lyase [Roseibium marinum]|uniref:Diaminopropionate ammonia-lyase n=1 Tax=Roseibium marinum TaxID=281252 RepID=A0A2S3V1P6_9HYPH|nr:diaminopropionate ammonia-lyase [Roseibium marinum]POF33609.1 diaminopropionate ammonia-lyase [Roseibium marinum]
MGHTPEAGFAHEFCLNGLADRSEVYGPDRSAILNAEAFETARATITGWPGYAPTPLVSLPGIAKQAGIAALAYKNEASRFGLGSFKALGGAYAVWRVLHRSAAQAGISPSEGKAFAAHAAELTVTCATDGNHGRSVAWGARTFGCNCVIFIHETVSEGRKQAIENFSARVVRCKGNYDDSVREAQRQADANDWTVVSDTSYPGYTDIPRDVMQGYELMAFEALDQWPHEALPTHVFLQTGVGGMAAAVVAHFWRRFGADRPVFVLADPLNSACWLETIRNGAPTVVDGDIETVMAGLACGEISELAWSILEKGADAVVGLPDESAVEGMKLLADGRYGDRPQVAGESAVAGLMALLAVSGKDAERAALGLTENARVLVFGTEGATDPLLYEQLVGLAPDEVGS